MEAFAHFVEQLAERVPLELFVLVGTFLEEVISPLPSFIVLVPAGAVAQVQGMPLWYIGVLALLSAVGRVAGAIILYWLADRFEDAVFGRRRLFGFSHKEVERFGRRLGRSGRRSWFLLFTMHALPIFPTALLSLACGFVKVPYRMFLTTTFFGTIVNAVIYMGIGYAGIMAAGLLDGLELAGQIITALLLVVLLVWLFRRHRRK
ncbi:MAG TPA: VTT domain-containing protein [Candidatus Saccharimonadales bacterium]|nr:VTT domain-containing protein [Candidatus Saccharimonadales bacterium]